MSASLHRQKFTFTLNVGVCGRVRVGVCEWVCAVVCHIMSIMRHEMQQYACWHGYFQQHSSYNRYWKGIVVDSYRTVYTVCLQNSLSSLCRLDTSRYFIRLSISPLQHSTILENDLLSHYLKSRSIVHLKNVDRFCCAYFVLWK